MRNLNPRGRNFYKVIIPSLVQWFGFTEPKPPYDESAGVQFLQGEFSPSQDGRDCAGVSLTVYFNGMLAQTQTNTIDSDRFLEQMLTRLAKDGAIAYQPDFVKFKGYQSEVLARAERSVKFPEFTKFCSTLTKMAYPEMNQPVFSTTGIVFDTDPEVLGVNRKRPQFTLERKVDVNWSDNLYFSQAPLSTPQHAEAINELEGILST